MKANLYFASGALGENMKMQQTNHFVVDFIFMFSSGARLHFVLYWDKVAQITHYKI
jgi:hypothetical protein